MLATLLTVQGLYGLGLQRWAPWVGLILAVLCVGLNVLLLPRVGVVGVAWSWAITEVAECVIVGLILLVNTRRTCSI